MKANLLFIIMFITTTSLYAFTTEKIQGTLVNKTSYPIENIRIKVSLLCSYVIIVDQYLCGEKETTVTPAADGTFTIPSMTLSPGLLKEKYIEAFYTITVNGVQVQRIVKFDDKPECFHNPKCTFERVKKNITKFTLLQLPELKIEPKFTSGISSEDFYQDPMDPRLPVDLIETLGKSSGSLYSSDGSKFSKETASFTWKLPIQLIPGTNEENLSLTINPVSSLCAKASATSFAYSFDRGYIQEGHSVDSVSVLFNDQNSHGNESCINSYYLLNGSKSGTLLISSDSSQNSISCSYKADFSCDVSGHLSGEIKLETNSYNHCPDADTTVKSIAGTCGKKTSTFEFYLKDVLLKATLEMQPWEAWWGDVFESASAKKIGNMKFNAN